MRNGLFTPEEKIQLLSNKYVVDVVQDSQVIYSNEFKQLFIKAYNEGKKTSAIFNEAGFDTKVLGTKRIERACYRWRQAFSNGVLEVSDAGEVRHKEGIRKSNRRIESLKKQHRDELKSLQGKINQLQAHCIFLSQRLKTAEAQRHKEDRLRVDFYIKEGVDVSKLLSYMGERIAQVRKEHGISMVKLSSALGFSHSTLREIEHGNKPVPIDTLLKIMVIFDCPIDYFFKEDLIEIGEE